MESQKNWNFITIPNAISFIRLLLIPVFAVFYFCDFENHLWFAIATVFISGVSDIVDGFIARHFNMISNFGKIIDPAADKLTQATVLICLSISHPTLWIVTVLLFAKEICQLIGAILLSRQSGATPPAARWWGKTCTVVLFLTMITTVLADIITGFPDAVCVILHVLSIISLIFAFIGYYLKIYKDFTSSRSVDDKLSDEA